MSAKKDETKKVEEAVEEKAAEPKEEAKKETKKETKKEAKAETKEETKEEAKETKEEKAEEKEAVKASSKNVEKIVEMVETMTVLELSELVKVLEDRFGVSAAAPMMMAGMMPAGGAAEEAEEKTEFDVILKDFGSQKIQVIKVVRAITGAGLIEAKKMVEEIPSTIKEGIAKDEAESIKKQIEEAGAVVEIK